MFCRYMGTITGISDLDPVRWKNSQWRNLQVGFLVVLVPFIIIAVFYLLLLIRYLFLG
jgi:zona occludens toxin (predicted ATPase)